MNIRIEFSNVESVEAIAIAEALKILSGVVEGPKVKPDFKKAAKEVVADHKARQEAKAVARTKTKYTLDELRKLAIDKASSGNSAGVKKILESFGLEKVTAVTTDKIDELYLALEAL